MQRGAVLYTTDLVAGLVCPQRVQREAVLYTTDLVAGLVCPQTRSGLAWSGIGGIRPHASEETGALNQCLGPLGHATYLILLTGWSR